MRPEVDGIGDALDVPLTLLEEVAVDGGGLLGVVDVDPVALADGLPLTVSVLVTDGVGELGRGDPDGRDPPLPERCAVVGAGEVGAGGAWRWCSTVT